MKDMGRGRARAAGVAGLLLGLLVAGGCVTEPEIEGRACASTSPCPEPLVCAADGTCHTPCGGDEDCQGETRCMDGLCLPVVGNQTCAGDGDCGAGEVCRGGICEPEAALECQVDADCSSPGVCQAAAGARCEAGRCLYAALECDAPPPPECVDGDAVFRTYGSGGCQASTGTCAYAATDTPCPSCQATCLTPCEGVTCPDAAGGCRIDGRCEPGAPGAPARCVYVDATDGAPCRRDDGGDGACRAGRCVACAGPADCDDANTCTEDQCDPSTGACRHAPRAGACDDGNACTSGDTCTNGLCRGTSQVTCDSPPGPCYEATGTCDGATGACTYAPSALGTPCADDGLACTSDQCDGNGACTHPAAPVGTRCDDGLLCTYADQCDAAGRCAGTTIVCDDVPGVCGAARSCNGTAQCAETYPGAGASCDDNNACTHTDRCNGAGGCQGTSYSCNDGDLCTQDVCDGLGGCANTRGPPTGLAPTGGANVARQDVTLVWSPCTTATEYEVVIQYQAADGTWRGYFTYSETQNTKTFWPCSSTSPGAPCNSDFRFRVRARTAGAWGPYSPWATFFWANCRAC